MPLMMPAHNDNADARCLNITENVSFYNNASVARNLHILAKKFIKNAKNVQFRPNSVTRQVNFIRTIISGKCQNSKDILAWFSNTVMMVVKWLDWDFLHWIIQKFFLGPESICIILEVKEKSVVHKALKLEGSTGVHHINHCLVISAQNILFSKFSSCTTFAYLSKWSPSMHLFRLNTTEMQNLELL